jgi:peptidoglycan/LPS O-acetylase OafA/YrhL
MLLQGTLIPLLLIGTVAHPSQWVGRLLELRLMRLIGRISYGLYLWQQLFTASGADSFRSKFLYLQHFPWNVLAIFACASLSYYLLERRMIQTGHKLTSRRPATLTIAETKLPQSSIASSLGT